MQDFCSKFALLEMERRISELKDQLLCEGEDYYSDNDLRDIEDKISSLDDRALEELIIFPKKSKKKARLLAIFLGLLGVDEFYIGNTALGIAKLFTLGGCFVLYIIDIIKSKSKVEIINKTNFDKIYGAIKK